MSMGLFEDILQRNNLDYVPFEVVDDTLYTITIPYKNTVTLSFISSLIGDLANNGFKVNQKFGNNEVSIEAILVNPDETVEEVDLETSAAYYLLNRWAKKLNKKLKDLEVVIEKDDNREGAYGEDSEVYIINPTASMDELLYIVNYFDSMGVELEPMYFRRDKIDRVENNEYLEGLGYSPDTTYLSFPVLKNPRY